MKEYHKIQTVFLRDPAAKFKTLLNGEFAKPEFEYLANLDWLFTEKVDGTNIRVVFDGQLISFYGKTDGSQIPAFLLNKLRSKFDPFIEQFAEMFPDGVCFYGEGYGAKIQKGGGNYRQDQDFVLFDVKVSDWWLERKNVEDVAARFHLDVVPVIGVGTLYTAIEKTRVGFTSLWGDFTAEGIVARPAIELKNRAGERVITKIKHRDF